MKSKRDLADTLNKFFDIQINLSLHGKNGFFNKKWYSVIMKKNTEKYIISVTPLIKIPLNREQFFYYSHSHKIPCGSLVEIPFGKRKIKGIVIDSKNDFSRLGNMELKKVGKILEKNFLTKKQLQLAEFVSDYYIYTCYFIWKH